jgi:amidase
MTAIMVLPKASHEASMTGSLLGQLNSAFPDASAIAESVRAGTTSASQMIDEARSMADASHDLNAFISQDWERAATTAEGLDERRGRGLPLGPMAGVPITVKDVIAVAGLPLTAGSAAFSRNIATATAPVAQRLLDADAILIGKTNCPEFAFGVITDSIPGGRARNPRFPGATTGGSSGGEAAAVAAGISALGVGTDFGGSLRWPAQCVGISAFRPSAGQVPDQGLVPGLNGYLGTGPLTRPGPGLQGETQVIGPMARSVRDLKLAFGIMSGLPEPELQPGPDLRIAWSSGTGLGPVRLEVQRMMAALAEQLARAGHNLLHLPELFEGCLSAYNHLRSVDPMLDHSAAVVGHEDRISPRNLDAIRRSLTSTPKELSEARSVAEAARGLALDVFKTADIVLLPVAGGPASDVEGNLDIDGQQVGGWDIMRHCRAVTLTGAPTVSLPVAMSSEGLPLAVQVIAAPGKDWLALQFAEQLQHAGTLSGLTSVPQVLGR